MNSNKIYEKINELAELLHADVYCGSGVNSLEFHIPTEADVITDEVYKVDSEVSQFYITLNDKDGGFEVENFLKDNLNGCYDLFFIAVYAPGYTPEIINNLDKLDMLIEKTGKQS